MKYQRKIAVAYKNVNNANFAVCIGLCRHVSDITRFCSHWKNLLSHSRSEIFTYTANFLITTNVTYFR